MTLLRRSILFGAFTVFLLLVGAGTIRDVIGLAIDSNKGEATHILVIPFASAFVFWLRRKTIFGRVRFAPVCGAVVMILGSTLFVAGRIMDVSSGTDRLSLTIASLLTFWIGGFLFIYGRETFRVAVFPLLLLFLAVPIPAVLLDRMVAALQSGSAAMAYGLIRLAGIPVYRQGLVFALPDLVIEVAPACSGFRSAISIFIASLIAGHLLLKSIWKKLFLVSVAIPVLFFKNAVRIAVLSFLAVHWDKRVMSSALHHEGGSLFFLLGLCLLYPVLATLVKSERYRPSNL